MEVRGGLLMRKRWLQIIVALLIIIVFIIGGFIIMGKQKVPNTPAFNHDFTKEFLVKDAETPEGYHLFESGTKKYRMLFPENYVMSDGSYYQKKGVKSNEFNTENVYLYQEDASPKEDKLIKEVNLFLKPDGNAVIEATLDVILDNINASSDTEFEKYIDESLTIYYVENIDDYHADGIIDRNFYFYGFITDNNSKQAIYFEMRDKCFNINAKKCTIDFEEEKKKGLKMMKSVEFM